MNLLPRRPARPVLAPALEARMGANLARALNTGLGALPADVSERLRAGREQALERARHARVAMPARATAAAVLGGANGAALLGDPTPWWSRALSLVPLLVLLLGLFGVEQAALHEQVLAAADIDAQLLADDLPPAAYADPGFAEFLRSAPPP